MRLLRHIILLSDAKRTNELVVSVQHFDYSLNRRSKSSNLKFRDKGYLFGIFYLVLRSKSPDKVLCNTVYVSASNLKVAKF